MRTLAQLIDNAAERAPDDIAFRCQHDQLSFGELILRCNQLGRVLQDAGIARGDRVGVLMPRCLNSSVAVHAIMRLGAVFVPIDPLTPAVRVAQVVQDCGITTLVTDKTLRSTVSQLCTQQPTIRLVVGIDELESESPLRVQSWASIDSVSADPLQLPTVAEDDLAYMMYTSGSTGQPKGIMHTHFSGYSYAEISAATYDVRRNDRIGSHSPLHFDMSTFGYMTAPLVGATTILIPAAYTKMPASLSDLMSKERITIWYSVPFALIQLLHRGVLDQRDLTSLRWVMFGGESMAGRHVRELMQAWPHARFSNVYGPAEVNQCTYYHLDANTNVQDTIPIGTVWKDTEAILLENDTEVPHQPDATGELLIKSPTMMKGYWNRDDLNKRAFYDSTRNGRYYRTGDLVQIGARGELVFLGRKDRQIKLRGQRIELDDIESALMQHSDIEEVGVYPIRNNGETVEIHATVLPKAQTQLIENDLRSFVSDRLPGYAVPSKIVVSDQLPRTTSGKVDRRQLQAMAEQELASS